MNKGIIAVSLIAVFAISGSVVLLQNNEEHVVADEPTPILGDTVQRSSKVYINPETGELTSKPPVAATPTATGNSKLVLPSNSKLKPIETIQRPDGSTLVILNGRGLSNDRVSVDCNNPALVEHLKKSSRDIADCEAAK